MVNSLLHRKESLILTTIEIVDELGIQKLTTREIAKRQQVSEATIFRHYQNKNDLLTAVLDYFTQYDRDILDTVRLKSLTPLAALQFLINSYTEYYENYPAITSILQLFDVLRYEPELAEQITRIQEGRTAALKQFIDEAIQNEEIVKEADSEMMAIMISGMVRELCLNWRIHAFAFSLRERAQVALEMLLNAFLTESSSETANWR